ncbi:MAG: biopolymer transporter ExbD [Oxalobacteraceae bacterium]|jgi:biopolymer transport protein ExbD|nr:biopolymer transporter ExbD [Oxalobacteraceae bacterium]
MNFRQQARRDQPEINLIAFIDVLLVILIFLMISTSFSRVTGLAVRLPTVSAEASTPPKSLHIAVDAEGGFALNGRRVAARDAASLAQELRRLAAGDATQIVDIHADAQATHQSVVSVMEAARLAGLSQVTFSAQSNAP